MKKPIKIPIIQKGISVPVAMAETKLEWKPVKLKMEKTLVIADLHVPFHDKRALESALNYGVKYGCKDVLILGDFIDCYSLSYFQRDINLRDFSKEIALTKQIVAIIDDNFSGQKAYLMGNHEERFTRYTLDKIPEMLNIPELSFTSLLGIPEEWRFINEKRPVKIGKLNLFHGHELSKGFISPVNPARTLYLKTKINAIVAHHHKTSQHTETTLDGDITSCWSIGCLAHLHPMYAPINSYNHGFCIVDTTTDDEDFVLQNFMIRNGKIY